MKIKWLGHAAFKIISEKGIVIYIDPWIEGNPSCPIKLEDINEADIVCVTHGHNDHLGNALEIVKKTGAKLVGSPEMCHYAEKHGIAYNQESISMNIGGKIVEKGITIHATHSVHVSAIYGEEWRDNQEMIANGSSMGFVIEAEDGIRIYHAGDTGLTYDFKIIGDVYNPHIAMLPIGGRYTMTPQLAAQAAVWIGAPKVIPMHFNTFEFNRQDPEAFQQLINNLTSGIEVVKIQPGEIVSL